jgi:hypothetical protein
MRYLFIALFILVSIFSFGQTSNIDSLTFCNTKYKVPTACSAESEYQITCDKYSIVWLYMNEQMLNFMPDQFISQMAGQMKNFKKEPISCYLLDNDAKGYKISFKKGKKIGYQLIAYGIVNGQPVFVQLSLDKEPKSNDDIPSFPRQIIRLTK